MVTPAIRTCASQPRMWAASHVTVDWDPWGAHAPTYLPTRCLPACDVLSGDCCAWLEGSRTSFAPPPPPWSMVLAPSSGVVPRAVALGGPPALPFPARGPAIGRSPVFRAGTGTRLLPAVSSAPARFRRTGCTRLGAGARAGRAWAALPRPMQGGALCPSNPVLVPNQRSLGHCVEEDAPLWTRRARPVCGADSRRLCTGENWPGSSGLCSPA